MIPRSRGDPANVTKDQPKGGRQKKTSIFYFRSKKGGGAAQCLRIGVQEDIFVSDHIQAFGKQKNLQLG